MARIADPNLRIDLLAAAEAAFIANDYGRAAAASVLLALVSALLSALVMRLSARRSR